MCCFFTYDMLRVFFVLIHRSFNTVNDPIFSLSLDKKDTLACITEEACPRIATGRLPLCLETNVSSKSAFWNALASRDHQATGHK
jgi:hypothetical protein